MKLFTRSAPEVDPNEPFTGSPEELLAEIERLRDAVKSKRNHGLERRLLRLRHLAGAHMLESAQPGSGYAQADGSRLPDFDGSLPEVKPAELTASLLRAAILRDGCLLVRELISPRAARQMAKQIDRSFAAREHFDAGRPAADGYYEEFAIEPQFDPFLGRPWIKMGGGVYAADTPALSFELAELLHGAGVPRLVDEYLGEPSLISVQKTTLRKADPSVPGTWHQDGKFMGRVRSLNVWVALSHCGDTAPGLDVVPRRLEEFAITGTEESTLDTWVSNTQAREAAGERGILRPIFEPGDALLFDEMFLHQTAAEASMPHPRFALEVWFFAASAFPKAYAPIAL